MRSIHPLQLGREITRECEINNNRLHYDICSSESLEVAKESMGGKFIYIGSGYTYYIDGVENISKDYLHFFIKKTEQ